MTLGISIQGQVGLLSCVGAEHLNPRREMQRQSQITSSSTYLHENPRWVDVIIGSSKKLVGVTKAP